MKWSISNLGIIFGFLVALVVLVVVSISTYQNSLTAIETNQRLLASRSLPIKLGETVSLLKDAENARRIYVVTGKDWHLDRYYASLTTLNLELSNIRGLMVNNPKLQPQFVKLNSLITKRILQLNQSIASYKNLGFDFDIQNKLNEEGKLVMDSVQKTVSMIALEQNQQINQQVNDIETNQRNIAYKLLSGIFLSGLILLGTLYLVLYKFNHTAKEYKIMSKTQQHLEQKVGIATQQYEVAQKELAIQKKKYQEAEGKIAALYSELEQKVNEHNLQTETKQKELEQQITDRNVLLKSIQSELASQVAIRKQGEEELRRMHSTLERQAMESSLQLQSAKEELNVQISARNHAEEESRNKQLGLERKIMERSVHLDSIQKELQLQSNARKQAEETKNSLRLDLERKIIELTVQLESVYKELATQTTARKQAEEEIGKHRLELEQKITERNKELESITQKLDAQIIARKQIEEELKLNFEQLRNTLDETVNSLAAAVEKRYPYMSGHQQRVAQLACAIAKEMMLPFEQIEGIRIAGLLHEIGNLNIPTGIIGKVGPLNSIELRIMQMHPEAGYDILKTIEFPWPVAQIVYQHHERIDGSGYPQGLKSDSILLEARILGVADTVEAMASQRTYRSALGVEKALAEISTKAKTVYDPQVVEACVDLFTESRFGFVAS
jgi:HD-GYP domain-containing protein (c-di-GMP phosphodiesterase class II)/CHASE3 domain sensor protein